MRILLRILIVNVNNIVRKALLAQLQKSVLYNNSLHSSLGAV